MTAWRFLFFSILCHVLLLLILLNNPVRPFGLPKNESKVDVVIVDKKPAPKNLGHIRQEERLKNRPDLRPAQQRFLGQFDQSVEKNTRARNRGVTQNRMPAIPQNLMPTQDIPQDNGQEDKSIDNGTLAFGPPKDQDNRKLKQLGKRLFRGQSSSTIDEFVREGDMNSLNTERFTFYSFFSRLEERIIPLWQRNIDNNIPRIPGPQRSTLGGHAWITMVEVLLDSEGKYLETILHGSSGIPLLDANVVDAFREASFFPNPPTGLVQSDGKIHIKYSFKLKIEDEIVARHRSN